MDDGDDPWKRIDDAINLTVSSGDPDVDRLTSESLIRSRDRLLVEKAYAEARRQMIAELENRVRQLERLVDNVERRPDTSTNKKRITKIWGEMRRRGVPTYVEELVAARRLLKEVDGGE